jgi:hypothetical protein
MNEASRELTEVLRLLADCLCSYAAVASPMTTDRSWLTVHGRIAPDEGHPQLISAEAAAFIIAIRPPPTQCCLMTQQRTLAAL